MLQHPYMNMEETVVIVLFGTGFTILLPQRSLIKKTMGMNIMDTAMYPFPVAKGCIEGRMMPVMVNGSQDPADYTNPIPSGLVPTGIVVSVSVTALMLALTMQLYQQYGSLNLDKITIEAQKEEP